jgi:hypothetical protein
MMPFHRRRHAVDDFIEGIRPELRAIPTPSPTAALKARIIASRATGVRHILPVLEEESRSGALWPAVAVAVTLATLLIPIGLHRSPSIEDDVVSPGFFGQVAFAQNPPRVNRPSFAPVRATGTKLRPLSLELERYLIDSAGRRASTGTISLQLSAVSVADIAAWRVVSILRDRLPAPHVDVESVYVAKADLRLLRRDIHVAPYRRFQRINVAQRFTGDSISGRMTTEGPSIGAGRAFARQLPRSFAPVITEGLATVFLMGVPLSPEWRGSASVLGWAVRADDVLLPVGLVVEGEETITVPAGRFDCWRLSLRFPTRKIQYWVRKSDALGVRVLYDTDATTKGTREIVLRSVK